jgi:hypothetical protein
MTALYSAAFSLDRTLYYKLWAPKFAEALAGSSDIASVPTSQETHPVTVSKC